MINVLVVVGHTKNKDKGAYSEHLKKSEYDYNLNVANVLKSMSNDKIKYDIYTHSLQDYYKRQKVMADFANSKKYDLIIELHFNAASPTANGTECLHYFSSKKGKELSKLISQDISENFNTKIRSEGAKALVSKLDRGFYFTYLPKAVAIIIEPFFGSNVESLKFEDVSKYAKTLNNTIYNFYTK